MNSNLNVDEGLKRFTINGDETRIISFNPNDFSIIERINEIYSRIDTAEEMKSLARIDLDGTPVDVLPKCAEAVNKANGFIKSCINYIFDSDVADIVFGKQSPFSTVKGVPFYERFLSAVVPEIQKAVEEEQKASKKRIEKYTKVAKK